MLAVLLEEVETFEVHHLDCIRSRVARSQQEFLVCDIEELFADAPFVAAVDTSGSPVATASGANGNGPSVAVDGGSLVSGRWYAVRKNSRGQSTAVNVVANMTFRPDFLIAFHSQVMTLLPGDIISTGTPAGVMLNKPNAVFLKDGDKVEMEIENLGILNNTIKIVKSN